MASTLTASLTRPAPTAVRGLGSSKLSAQPLSLPAPLRAAQRARASVVVRAEQQQSRTEKPEVAQVCENVASCGLMQLLSVKNIHHGGVDEFDFCQLIKLTVLASVLLGCAMCVMHSCVGRPPFCINIHLPLY